MSSSENFSKGTRQKNPNSNGVGNKYDRVGMSEKMYKQVYKWTAFYRKYPFRYVEDCMNIKLKIFQKIMLYIMFNYNFVCFLASRGLGKSWLTSVLIHVRCVLFPNTQVVIASGIKSQACNVIEYIDKFRNRSDAVRIEIKFLSTSKNDAKIDYWNGSTVRITASNDGARGLRANYLVLDEYRLVPKDVLDLVLRKFRSNTRYCGYLNKPEYKHVVERNKEIYLSSCYYRHHWAYAHFMAFFNAMLQGGSYFTCCLPYQLAVMENIKNLEELMEEYNEETTDELMWQMEYECKWIGENDGESFFKYDKLENCRTLTKCLYPPEIAQELDMTDKHLKSNEKPQNATRILFMDFARKESGKSGENDATSIGVMDCYEVKDKKLGTSYFMREVPYIETSTGVNSVLQTIRMYELFDWFECDYIAIDAQSLGGAVIDNMAVGITDPKTGKEYKPLNCINHAELNLGVVLYPNAPKVIYGYMGSAPLNSKMGYDMRDTLAMRRIQFLCDETSCRRNISEIKGYDLLSPELKGKLMRPFVQTSALINEMVSLEYKISPTTNLLSLVEKSGARKDRYMSLAYGLNYSNKLEKELFAPKNKFENIMDLVGFDIW